MFPEPHGDAPERLKNRDLQTTGILPSQEIRELIRNGKIRCSGENTEDQIQPASLDLRLGKVAYRVQASFLPGKSSTVDTKIEGLKLAEIDLSQGALLERGAVFIVPLMESLALPADIGGKANPKSTTGRLDIFTRLITNGGIEFEHIPKGYSGELYVEIVSRTFPIKVRQGAKLNQVRFVRGNPPSTDGVLGRLDEQETLVFEDEENPAHAFIQRGLRISIDLEGSGGAVAYKARRNPPAVDLAKVAGHDPEDFWERIPSPRSKRIVLDPGDFYLLASSERIRVPLTYAAEMEPFDASIGEFSVHYAGFFDPGFGYGSAGEITGTKAVLEVRAHEVPILLEDRQIVGRLIYHKMMKTPDKVYGQAIGSSYQRQGLALSKQFRSAPDVALSMKHG
ncbi:MAG: 2'-deoxycytidine 5'-triphosphate deaminase [Terriglobia bacterium]